MLPLFVLALAFQPQPATLTKVEQTQGYKLYSGADAASLWRGYKQPAFPAKGWKVAGGVMSTGAGTGGGDIITKDQFGDVEIVLQYKTAPKANSGIMYRVTEKYDASYLTGPEYQILEDVGYGVKLNDPHSAGALYDLYTPADGKKESAADWNDARIYIRNGVIQHWLNGTKLVDVVAFDDAGKPTKEWQDKIAASKFKTSEGFGIQPKGHIALQEHGDAVAFRNIKIRDLGAHLPAERVLWNGKDLTGWEAVVPEAAKAGIKPESVWTVENGILICKGNPVGYIRTKEKFTNYVLKVQWRFNPVTKKAGNSGVLLRMVGEDKVWPKSVEAQLQSGSAGDFWNIDNVKMTAEPSRTNGRNTKHTHASERPIGEWNEYEIIVNHGDVILNVNGEELNRAKDVEEVAGYICLQSEGAEIQFRDIRLAPLP